MHEIIIYQYYNNCRLIIKDDLQFNEEFSSLSECLEYLKSKNYLGLAILYKAVNMDGPTTKYVEEKIIIER